MKFGTLKPNERLVYESLVCAADAGRPCPSNADLAAVLGCASIGTAPGVLKRLTERGLITVERFQMGRRVTIVATGKRTAEVKGARPHWRDRKKKTRQQLVDELAGHLSKDATLQEAADAMCMSVAFIRRLFAEMRAALGWQAK